LTTHRKKRFRRDSVFELVSSGYLLLDD